MITNANSSSEQTGLYNNPAQPEKMSEVDTDECEPITKKSRMDTEEQGDIKIDESVKTCDDGSFFSSSSLIPKLTIEKEFSDPALLESLKGKIRNKIRDSVTKAVNRLATNVSMALEEIDALKKLNAEYEKHVKRLENVSRKVERAIEESLPPKEQVSEASNKNGLSDSQFLISSNKVETSIDDSGQCLVSEALRVATNGDQSFPTPVEASNIPQVPLASSDEDPNQDLVPVIAPLPEPNHLTGLAPKIAVQPPPVLQLASSAEGGISVQWHVEPVDYSYEPAKHYELVSYAEMDVNPALPLTSDLWQLVGYIDALALPMSASLSQVKPGTVYYFAVRSRDQFERSSEWSNVLPLQIAL